MHASRAGTNSQIATALAAVGGIFDESILVREGRRWKAQKRWTILVAACVFCSLFAAPLLLNLLSSSSVRSLDNDLLGRLAEAVVLCGSLLAFYQSMQVLRQEMWGQTLEGLLLTLQSDRGVILSVIGCGLLAGAAPVLLFLPLLVFCGTAMSAPALNLLMVGILAGASVFVSACAGALSFFVAQRFFTINVSPARIMLIGISATLLVALCGQSSHFLSNAQTAGPGVFWSLLLAVCIGAAFWSVKTSWGEAGCLRGAAPRRRGSSGALVTMLVVLPALLLVVLALSFQQTSTFTDPTAGAGFGFTIDVSNVLLLTPMVAAAHLISDGSAAGPASTEFWKVAGPTIALSIASFFVLLGLGFGAAACALYRRVRHSPELTLLPSSARLKVVNVGHDDWRGFGNPILTRELRTRLRSGDARIFISFAAALSAAACLIPLLSSFGGDIKATQIASYARDSFAAVGIVQIIIACLVGPGVGAEVIAAERERKTFEMLVASRLTASQILRGKAQGCMALLLLLLSPSFPLLAVAAFLHGVTASAVLALMAGLVYFTFLLSVVCVSISALAHNSASGKWIAYVTAATFAACYGWAPSALAGATFFENGGGLTAAIAPAFALLLWFPAVRRIQDAGYDPKAIPAGPVDCWYPRPTW